MKSKTSFFNGTLFRKNVTRCLPLWVLYTLFLVIALLLPVISTSAPASAVVTDWGNLVGVVATFAYAILCAACCFGYLHKTRSTNMLHALPLTRTALFVTNYISGFLFAFIPNLLVIGLSMLACRSESCVRLLLQLLAMLTLEQLFFYGLAVFCMVLCGRTSAGVVIYFLLNFLFVILGTLSMLLIRPMICGLRDGGDWYLALSPAWKLFSGRLMSGELTGVISWTYPTIIAAAGVAMSVLAWLLNRIRRLEAAGDLLAYQYAKPVAKYLFTYLCSLCLGLLISDIVFEGTEFTSMPNGVIACLLVGGFIGFVGAEMLLQKTLRVFRLKAIAGFAVYAVVLSLCLLGIRGDWLGVVRYIPQSVEIQSVSIGTEEEQLLVVTDTADIEAVRAIHGKLSGGAGWVKYPNFTVNLTYTLTSGKTVSRCYGVSDYWIREAETEDAQAVYAFYSRPELVHSYYDAMHIADSVVTVNTEKTGFVLSSRQAAELYAAMCEDIDGGSLVIFNRADSYSTDGTGWYLDLGITYKGSDNYISIPEQAVHTRAYVQTLESDW